MSRIQDENRYYNQQLSEKYVMTSGANLFLSVDELAWLSEHGPIRVGYQDNYLSFCAADASTGELTGALKNYLEEAASCFKNANLDFEPVAYPTAAAAMEALRNGEVDCMFPSNLGTSDGEEAGFAMTPAMMRAEADALVRRADYDAFAQKEHVTVAIVEGNPNYDAVVMDNFPDWEVAEHPDLDACLKAVADGKADCVLISNYQYNSLARQCEGYNLVPLNTGIEVDYHIAVNSGDNELYSILARTTNLVSSASTNASLTQYSAEEARTSLVDFIWDNLAIVIAALLVVAALVAVIILQRRMIVMQRRAEESEHRVEDLSERVYVDALTQVRNKGAFDEYVRELQDRMDQGERFDCAIGVFDCDDLKATNDRFGHEKGNVYLTTVSHLICEVFQHSPVFRVGGDEFCVILMNEDYRNREELMRRFAEEQARISASSDNAWEHASIAMGVAVYDPQVDSTIENTAHRADLLMYENKRLRKESRA